MNHSRKTKAQLLQELAALQQRNTALEQALSQRSPSSEVWWASEENLRAALQFLPLPISIATAGGDILYFNQQFTDLYGYTRADVPTLEAWMRTAYPDATVRESVLTVWEQDVAEAIRSGKATPAREYLVTCKDETPRTVEIVMRAVGDLWMAFFNDVTLRRQAEEEIHRSRSMLMHVLNSVPQAVFWKDRNSVYLGCNEVFARAAGLPEAASVVGKTDFDLPWLPPEAAAYRADDAEVVEHNQIKRHIIEPLQQADGTRLWIDTTKTPLTDEAGRVYGVLGVYDDVTERKQTNEALLESQKRLNKAQEIAHVGDWELDLDTQVLTASEEAFRIYGIAHTSPVLPLKIAQGCVLPEDRPRMDAALARVIARTGDYDEEFRIRRAGDGQLRYIHSRAELLCDANDRPVRVQGTLQDITQQKLAEAALRASEEQYRVLVDNINIGVFKSTLAGRFLLVNRAVVDMTGYTLAELLAQPTQKLYADAADREKMTAALRDQGAVSGMEIRFVTRDGLPYWVGLSAVLLPNDDGQPESIMGFVQDITERRRLAEAVQRSERRFRALVEHSADALTLISTAGTILYEGPTVARLTGYTAEERAGQSAMANVYPDDLPVVRAVLGRVLSRPGHSEAAQFRSVRKDGTIWWTEGVATNLLHEPHIEAIVVNYRDITERKRAERAEYDQRALAEALRDIATALSVAHELEEIFDVVVTQADRIVSYAVLRILLIENDGRLRVARQHIAIERDLSTG